MGVVVPDKRPLGISPPGTALEATVQAKTVLKAYYPARGDCGLNAHLTGDELGWRLAALVDGEGSFAISVSGRTRKSFRCSFLLGMRDDDRPFLELMRDSTGWGILFNIRRTEKALASRPGSKPMVHWQIERASEVFAFAELLDRYPPLSKKARDFRVWREAVDAWRRHDWQRMSQLRDELREGRVYRETPAPETLSANPQLDLAHIGAP